MDQELVCDSCNKGVKEDTQFVHCVKEECKRVIHETCGTNENLITVDEKVKYFCLIHPYKRVVKSPVMDLNKTQRHENSEAIDIGSDDSTERAIFDQAVCGICHDAIEIEGEKVNCYFCSKLYHYNCVFHKTDWKITKGVTCCCKYAVKVQQDLTQRYEQIQITHNDQDKNKNEVHNEQPSTSVSTKDKKKPDVINNDDQRVSNAVKTGTIPKRTTDTCFKCSQEIKENCVTCIRCEKIYHFECIQESSQVPVANNMALCCEAKQHRDSDSAAEKNNKKKKFTKKSFSSRLSVGFVNQTNPQYDENATRNYIFNNGGNHSTPFHPQQPPPPSPGEALPMMETPTANQTFLEATQIMFDRQNKKELPVVNDIHLSWRSFYHTYEETKEFFSAQENLNRVRVAIKCNEVTKIGGTGLLDHETLDETIQHIHNRIGNNINYVMLQANNLKRMAKPDNNDSGKILELLDCIVNFYRLVQAYDSKQHLYNVELVCEIATKLPPHLYNKWVTIYKSLKMKNQQANLYNLYTIVNDNIQDYVARHEIDAFLDKKEFKKPFAKVGQRVNVHQNATTSSTAAKPNFKYCWLHDTETHPAQKCKVLWGTPGATVIQKALEKNRCIICGQPSHDCPLKNKIKCNVNGCPDYHHGLYCPKRLPKEKLQTHTNICEIQEEVDYSELYETNLEYYEEDDIQEDKLMHIGVVATGYDQQRLNTNELIKFHTASTLLPMITVRINNKRNITCMIDTGSSATLIDEDVANELKLVGDDCPIKLGWTNGTVRTDDHSRVIDVQLSNVNDSNENYKVSFHTLKDLGVAPQRFISEEVKQKFPYLNTLNVYDYYHIDAILGVETKNQVRPLETFYHPDLRDDSFAGTRTPLGDYVFGALYPLSTRKAARVYCNMIYRNYHIISEEEQVELLDMERSAMNIYEGSFKTDGREVYEHEKAAKMLEDGVKRMNESSKYIAPLLWKNEAVKLPTAKSKLISEFRFNAMEKLLLADESKYEACENQVKSLIENNYAQELSEEEKTSYTDKSFYIPVFFIHPPNKRLRMIWDMACKVDGKSINDHLMSGPNLYNNMLKIIFQMCEHNYIIKSDIREMFHQVKLLEEDTEALRFFFKFRGDKNTREFKMNVLPFGAICSPAIAQHVKNKIGFEVMERNPKIADIIIHSTYVDDVITSVKTKEEAINIAVELKKTMTEGGFSLLKINSNDEEINDGIKEKFLEENIKEEDKQFSGEKLERMLGYLINFETDEISLAFDINNVPKLIASGMARPTKKEFLSINMSIFDPRGFFQFVNADFKVLYKKICASKIEWDEQIPEKLTTEWKALLKKIHLISNVKIRRPYYTREYHRAELYAFGDAGKDVTCCVAYARFVDDKDETINITLIQAQTFTVPEKPLRTIPELELQIALNTTELVKSIKEKHTIKFDSTYFFTDSGSVYEWITNGGKKETVYQRNRLEKIKKLSERDEWHWIPTELMPADYGTKQSAVAEIKYDNDWFFPKFFNTNWRECELRTHTNMSTHIIEDENIFFDFKDFSDYNKMLKKSQTVYKAIHAFRNIAPI